MDYTANLDAFGATLQIVLVDLLLSGDNALLIALACRSLGEKQARRAMRLGVGAAIVIRLLFTFFVSALLETPGLKLLGALALAMIAMQLMVADDGAPEAEASDAPERLAAAVAIIIIADLSMGLDNIVALAAIARGNFLYLAFGLALSVPILLVGSVLISRLLQAWPVLVTIGGALLGFIAGGLAASDALVADWMIAQAPALAGALPWMTAVFVVVQAWLARRRHTVGTPHASL
jgi:YjbE family integral membrane protein